MKKTFSELQNELNDILDKLQSADLNIDQAMTLHKHGEKIIAQLEDYLTSAKNEITHLKK